MTCLLILLPRRDLYWKAERPVFWCKLAGRWACHSQCSPDVNFVWRRTGSGRDSVCSNRFFILKNLTHNPLFLSQYSISPLDSTFKIYCLYPPVSTSIATIPGQPTLLIGQWCQKVFYLVLLFSLFFLVVDKVIVLTNSSHPSLLWQLCGLCATGPTPSSRASPDDSKPIRRTQDLL